MFGFARRPSAPKRLLLALFGGSTEDVLARWLFLRGLGLVYWVAFRSLRRQLLGLYGERGVLPIAELLDGFEQATTRDRLRHAPSVLWLDRSDQGLVRTCRGGELFATALMLGIAPRASAAACWALYLSFVSAGRDFLSFQWDALLLEAGLGGVLVAPRGLAPRWREAPPVPAVWLLRWLLFRLHFESGLAKLQSGDPTWRNLSASAYHHETQPLPAPAAWRLRELPPLAHAASTALVLAGECALPMMLLLPRPARRLAFSGLLALQGAIALSGNYGFFNLLAVVTGAWALDDALLGRAGGPLARLATASVSPPRRRHTAFALAVAAPMAAISTARLASRLGRPVRWRWLSRLARAIAPLSSINSYGLFSVMTISRPEVVIEGTTDGSSWKEYAFRFKPGDVHARPRRSAPHLPRLDWLFWFLPYKPPPAWLFTFILRLLEGAPEVRALLANDPFEDGPPLAVRATLYDYRMTSRRERAKTGAWWRRRRIGSYVAPLRLRGGPRTVSPSGDEWA